MHQNYVIHSARHVTLVAITGIYILMLCLYRVLGLGSLAYILRSLTLPANSLRHNDVIWLHRTSLSLFGVMAWGRTRAKPLPQTMLTHCQLGPKNKLNWIVNQNAMVAILFRPQCFQPVSAVTIHLSTNRLNATVRLPSYPHPLSFMLALVICFFVNW